MVLAMPGRALWLCAAALAAAAPAAAASAQGAPVRSDRLPDLDQEIPSRLDVAGHGAGAGRTYRLGFGSGVRNIGAGPLIVDGRRARGAARMVGRQLIVRSDGTRRSSAPVAHLRYVRSPDHQHWHLLGFDRYELRRAGGSRALVRDRKSGFCLGDRYRVTTLAVPAAIARPAYTGRCGLRRPGLRQVEEGISPGFGDFYAAHLEYQDLPIDGLRAGRYVLVHRVNGDRRLRESNYDNNAASMLLDLRWRNGVPRVAVLATCADSARCEKPAVAVGAAVPSAGAAHAAAGVSGARRMLCALSAGATPPAWGARAGS